MKAVRVVLTAAACLVVVACVPRPEVRPEAAGHGPGGKFVAGCLPFQHPGTLQEIDKVCPKAGNADPESPAGVEYTAKNFLCANGNPVDLTSDNFHEMESVAEHDRHVKPGQNTPSLDDRAIVQNLIDVDGASVGEGSLVRIVGYVAEVPNTYGRSDSKGEGVNCSYPGAELNDVHINVAPNPDSSPCQGIVVEMIPHHRPNHWNFANASALKGRAVRVTGHVFFDSRHTLVPCPKQGNPKRMSLFEIHPVYRFEVCRHGAECRQRVDDDWQDLEDLPDA